MNSGVLCCSQLKGNQFRFYKYLTWLINGNCVMNGHNFGVAFHSIHSIGWLMKR